MPSFPSYKALRAHFPDLTDEQCRNLRHYGKAIRAELEAHPAGARRLAECYHPPETSDLRMHVLDDIAGTFGVGAVYGRGQDPDDPRTRPALEYLNAGDTYRPTILRVRGRYRLGSWGDWAERHA